MRFKIPTQFESIGTTISVEFIDGDLTDNHGKYIDTENRILISKSTQVPEITFFHEFFHVCCSRWDNQLPPEQEEQLCELFGQLTHQLFKTAE